MSPAAFVRPHAVWLAQSSGLRCAISARKASSRPSCSARYCPILKFQYHTVQSRWSQTGRRTPFRSSQSAIEQGTSAASIPSSHANEARFVASDPKT